MIHALIADDHAVVRRGLKELLTDSGRIAVEGEAGTARETLEKVRERDWDVLILDINLPDRSGLDILRDVKLERPQLPVLILTVCSEDQFAIRALRSGAAGYLTKESAPGQLVDAVQKVVSGGRYISAAVAERLALHVGANGNRPPQELLSDREVAGSTAAPRPDARIVYRGRVLDKMGMRTNAELTYYAVRNQLVD